MQPKRLTDDQIQRTLTHAIEDAVAFVESEIAPARITAQKYFDGRVNLQHEEGRSKAVATKCRDTVRAIKPALMRVFLQSDKPVEFVPRRPETVDAAEQATNYAQVIFERNNGFRVLSDVFHDALIKKVGIVKVYYDEVSDVEFDEYTGLSEEMVALIEAAEDVEVLEKTPGPMGYDMRVSRQSMRGEIKFDSVAPEDFFVDRGAKGLDDCYVCGHSTEGRVSDLVEMGFDFEEVFNLAGTGQSGVDEEEDLARTGWDDPDGDENAIDPSMRKVLITEAYMRMDIEGTGVAKMYKFICGGQDYTILDYELCDHNPFAVFEVDPEPHTFFGRSLVDIITDDQDASTALLRGLLDAIAMANNPRVAVQENTVNMNDLLNNEIGGIVRTKGPPMNVIQEFAIGTAASNALPSIMYYDEVIRGKTGVTGAAMGMDPDALQSQTAAGVNAAVQAASAVSELIARTLAEGGMKQLVKTIAALARQHPNPDEMMRIDGEFVPVDPRSWTSDMDVICNVGLGTNRHEEKIMALQMTSQAQMAAFQMGGAQNGICGLTEVRNTQADLLKLMGVYNVDRHWRPMTPEMEMQMMQAQAQASQGSDPDAAFLQAEMGKAQIRAQTDIQKAQMKAQTDMMKENRERMKALADHDLERDRMVQDLAIEVAKILGQYGAQVDVAGIRQEQAANNAQGMSNGQ